MNDSPIARRSWRPRLSIRTALLLMTIVGLSITVMQLWRELVPLRVELRELRDEVGRLSVDDPTKPYAIQVRSPDEHAWKWRIWIPEDRSYLLKFTSERIPKLGFPANSGLITLEQSGETWIEYRLSPDAKSGIWYDTLSTPVGSVGSSPQDWVNWKQRTSTDDGVGHTTKEYEPGKPIVLARKRVSQMATDSSKIEDPAAGFMIWLEPTK